MFEIKVRETGELLEHKIKTEAEAKELITRWEAMDKIEDIYTDDYYEIVGEEEDDEYICPSCYGSGEGIEEGWGCGKCGGKGTIYLAEDF